MFMIVSIFLSFCKLATLICGELLYSGATPVDKISNIAKHDSNLPEHKKIKYKTSHSLDIFAQNITII
jgi:hypothetical protein